MAEVMIGFQEMRKPPQHGHITLTRLDSKPQDTPIRKDQQWSKQYARNAITL